jgi:hypothetical protein
MQFAAKVSPVRAATWTLSRAISNNNKISRDSGRRKSHQIECSKLRSTCKHSVKGAVDCFAWSAYISAPARLHQTGFGSPWGPFHIGSTSEDFNFGVWQRAFSIRPATHRECLENLSLFQGINNERRPGFAGHHDKRPHRHRFGKGRRNFAR